MESLKEKLKSGDKSLVGNKGYRRYLKSAGKEHFTIDEAKLAKEQLFDGMWVLRTNTAFAAAEVALKYKQLWMVESIFRSAKSLLETRPIYHKVDDTIRGHVFCSFLALGSTKRAGNADLRSKGTSWSGRISIGTFEHFRKWKWKCMARSCICAPTFAGYATRYCRLRVSRCRRRFANDGAMPGEVAL